MKRTITALSLITLLFFVIGSICWTYAIDAWLIFFGKLPVMTWWKGGLLGIIPFFGQWSIIVAIATWILMMFLV